MTSCDLFEMYYHSFTRNGVLPDSIEDQNLHVFSLMMNGRKGVKKEFKYIDEVF